MRKAISFLRLLGAMFSNAVSAIAIVITNGVQGYAGLTNSTMLPSNHCELRLTGTNTSLCRISMTMWK